MSLQHIMLLKQLGYDAVTVNVFSTEGFLCSLESS